MSYVSSVYKVFHLSLLAGLLSSLHTQAQNREVLAEYKIAFIGEGNQLARYQAAYVGARDAALELSQKYSIDLEVVELTPGPTAEDSQVLALAKSFVIEANAVLISPSASENLLPSLEYSQVLGQEIVFFERSIDSWTPTFEILADDTEAGRLMGERMLRELPSQTRVAILTSDQQNPNLNARLAGLRSALGYRRIETVVSTAPNYASAIATIQATEAADTNDHITGWVFLEDWPMIGFPALPWQPGDRPTITLSTNPTTLLYLEQGYVQNLVTHPYYDWGYQSMLKIVEKLYLEQSPEPAQVMTKPMIIGRNQLKAERENWKHWLQ